MPRRCDQPCCRSTRIGPGYNRFQAWEGGAHCPQCAGLRAATSKRVEDNALHHEVKGVARLSASAKAQADRLERLVWLKMKETRPEAAFHLIMIRLKMSV